MSPRAVLVAVSMLAALLPAPVGAQTIRFLLDETAAGAVTIKVTDSDADTTPETIEANAEGQLEYVVPRAEGQWRSEPTVYIDVKERELSPTRQVKPMTLQIPFSFTRSQSGDVFEITVAVLPETGRGMRETLDIMDQEPFRQFEQFLLAQGLTRHYLQVYDPPQADLTKYAARKWFDVLYRAVDQPPSRPLRLTAPVIDTLNLVFSNDGARLADFRAMEANLKSKFWLEVQELPRLLEEATRDCAGARSLVAYVGARHAAYPEGFDQRLSGSRLSGSPETYLETLQSQVDAACPST